MKEYIKKLNKSLGDSSEVWIGITCVIFVFVLPLIGLLTGLFFLLLSFLVYFPGMIVIAYVVNGADKYLNRVEYAQKRAEQKKEYEEYKEKMRHTQCRSQNNNFSKNKFGYYNNDSEYGIKTRGRDGQLYQSIGEATVANRLFGWGLKYSREVHYPTDPEYNKHGMLRTDWVVNGIYIEYFGLVGLPDYNERIKRKQALCEKLGLRLIELYPNDLSRLTTKLQRLKNYNVN